MSEPTEYRVEYTIQRRQDGEDDFTDIGFGSSGGWGSLDQAMHMASSAVECYEWETEPGMPDPEQIRGDVRAARDA